MGYNKSDESKKYNKEERGGWYCTNPKKHDEGLQHHSTEAAHSHPAERNDKEPNRHEGQERRYERQSQQKTTEKKWEPMSTTPPGRGSANDDEPADNTHEKPQQQQQKKTANWVYFIVIIIIFNLIKTCSESL